MSGWFDFNGYAFYDRLAHLGVYADLVTALGFKPSVASEKVPGGFDSHPLPLPASKPGFPWVVEAFLFFAGWSCWTGFALVIDGNSGSALPIPKRIRDSLWKPDVDW